jgi:hypothetical protein
MPHLFLEVAPHMRRLLTDDAADTGVGLSRILTQGGHDAAAWSQEGTKRARQYEHIKDSTRDQGASESRAEEIAARTVSKERARSGESRQRSRTSTQDMSSSRRGGQRSGTNRPKGRTRDQLYEEAKSLRVEGRSSMNKAQLERAIAGKKS